MAYRKMEIFNSIKYLRLLKNSGMTEQQAEIQIEMVQEANRHGLDHLATKELVINVQHELKDDNAKLRNELKDSYTELYHKLENDITNLRNELKDDNAKLRNELKDSYTELHHKLENDITNLRNELKDDNAKLRQKHLISFATLDKKINSSKWQVLASIFSIFLIMPFANVFIKYWGF